MTTEHVSDETTWDEILDALERALDTGEPFDPPSDPPPIPARLLERARAVMERQEHAAARIRAEMEELGRELERRPRPSRREAAPAAGAALSL